jgi:predicted porin
MKPMIKPTLLALTALLGASAQAQSNVTLYGRLNLSIERQKAGGGSDNWVMQNSSSRFGLKGTEDLGGGLKAGFVLEAGLNPSNGTSAGRFWGRQSEVNVGGGFGTVRLGNFTSEAYYATADYVSMHNHDTGTSADVFYADTRYFEQANKIGYRLPAFGGLTIDVATNTRDLPGETHRTSEIAANYDAGPLHLGAGLQKTDDRNQFALRGLYELGAFTVGGYVQRDENVYGNGKRTTVRLAGMYTMGGTELHANWGRAGDYSGVPGNSSANQWTLGVNYNLSRRSKIYSFYSKVDDKGTLYGGDFQSFAVGVRHNF